jgi:hypothetical protein
MDSYTATGIAEGFIEADSEDQVIEAWQTLIDTGLAWPGNCKAGLAVRHSV